MEASLKQYEIKNVEERQNWNKPLETNKKTSIQSPIKFPQGKTNLI